MFYQKESNVYFNINKIEGNNKKKVKMWTLFFCNALTTDTCENNLFRQKFSVVGKSSKRMSPQCTLVLEKEEET